MRISPHHHSGHYLPHEHTSYASIVGILLLIGMVLFGVTSIASADNVTVQAVVPGKPLTNAPTIKVPANGQRFSDIPINIQGTCDPGMLVNIYRNDVLGGAALCDVTGHFNLRSDLFIGKNDLVARMYNQANQPSPDSGVVSVYYDISSSPLNLVNGGVSGTNGQVVITAQSLYKGTVPGQPLSWPLEITGGTAPYAVSIDWGDGSIDLISRSQPGVFTMPHTYKKAGGYKGGYVINIKAVDAQGTSGTLQLVALVNEVGAPTFGSITPPGLGGRLMIAWPLWGGALLMVIVFWLGERRGSRKRKPRVPLPPIGAGSLS